MNKRSLSCLLLVFFLLAVSAYAKEKDAGPTKPLTADDIVAKMALQLGLTDQQALQVKPVIKNFIVQEEQIRKEEVKQLSHILTGQQMFTWNFLENEKQKNKKRHAGF